MELTQQEFNKIQQIPMVFVMGKERSGTTLLQTLLAGHPNIVAPPESEFILLLYPRFGRIKKWTKKNVLDFIKELYQEPWITKIWRIDRKVLTSVLLSIKDKVDYPTICKVIYYCMKDSKENVILLSDKNPIYALFADKLLKIFPEAKCIHLVRDPRDNVNSHLKSFKVNNVRFVAMKWLYYNTILQNTSKQMPDKFYTLLYENLVKDTESSMRGICAFLGISFHDNMAYNAFPEQLKNFTGQKLIFNRALDIHANLLKPVNTSNIGKWKTELSMERLQIVEAVTARFAAASYKYDIVSPRVLPLFTHIRISKSRIIYFCWQFFTRMKYRSYFFNKQYTKFNILIGRETRVFGKALRES